MQDSVKEMLKKFQGNYKEFKITLKLQQNASLLLSVLNTESLQAFELIVDQQYVDAKADFTNIFESPVEIIQFVSANFQEVAILQNGTIRFEFKFGGLKKKPKVINIETVKKEQDKLSVLELKIAQVKEILQGKIDEKQHKNLLLQKKVEKLQSEKQQMKKNIQSLLKQTQRLSKSVSTMLNFGYHGYDYENKDYCSASLNGELNTLRVKSLKTDGAPFINKQQIFPGQKVSFKIKLIHQQKQSFTVGFMTLSGIVEHHQRELFVYVGEKNVIFNGKQQKPVNITSKKGDIWTVQADLIANKITWKVNEVAFAEIVVPTQVKDKSLFLIVVFKNTNDEIEFLNDF